MSFPPHRLLHPVEDNNNNNKDNNNTDRQIRLKIISKNQRARTTPTTTPFGTKPVATTLLLEDEALVGPSVYQLTTPECPFCETKMMCHHTSGKRLPTAPVW